MILIKLNLIPLLLWCRGSLFHTSTSCIFTWWVLLPRQACCLQYGSMHIWQWHHWYWSHQVTPQLLAIMLVGQLHSLCQMSDHHIQRNTNIKSGELYFYLYWWKFKSRDDFMRVNMCSITALQLRCTFWFSWGHFCKSDLAFLFPLLCWFIYHVNPAKTYQLDYIFSCFLPFSLYHKVTCLR